ncbi:unnamed protein product [marine sediment metagenome]|uniref:Uncharacterized protein n=1 Tax=marine sediment metagenome TaxID=412755 RepID=X1KCB3_9ZZZZ
MKISKIPKPRKVIKLPKILLDALLPSEKKILKKQFKTRKDLNTPGVKIKFFKRND